MTISSTTSRVTYSGNDVTTAFSVTFRFLANEDLLVVLTDAAGDETTQVLDTDYTLTGAGDSTGGTLTMAAAPATGETLTIKNSPAITQTTDYTENDAFPAETHEDALDKLTVITQDHEEQLDRCVKLPVSSTTTDISIPEPSAGKALIWNDDADGLENGPDADEITSAQTYAAETLAYRNATAVYAAEAEAARDSAVAIASGAAIAISYSSGASGLAATNVQDAIDELDTTMDAYGTAVSYDVGSGAGQLVVLASGAKLPAVDGSNLTGIDSGQFVREIITSNATWTAPSGLINNEAWVHGIGGGGGGGGAQFGGTPTYYGAGGSGGGAAYEHITGLVAGTTDVSVTVGTGGTAGAATGGNGGNGGTSSFGAYCSATGGAGGSGNGQPTETLITGAAGAGSGGDVNYCGSAGWVVKGGGGQGGQGGGPWGGSGGKLRSGSGAGYAGDGFGGGGGGAGGAASSNNYAGGSGGSGAVIVEYFTSS